MCGPQSLILQKVSDSVSWGRMIMRTKSQVGLSIKKKKKRCFPMVILGLLYPLNFFSFVPFLPTKQFDTKKIMEQQTSNVYSIYVCVTIFYMAVIFFFCLLVYQFSHISILIVILSFQVILTNNLCDKHCTNFLILFLLIHFKSHEI